MNSEAEAIPEPEMSSFDNVNYGLRPNKSAERRLIFETLRTLGRTLDYRDYRYLGFGALLFVDFLLAHKELGIDDMVSIERSENALRAEKNCPLRCIRVLSGDSTAVLASGALDLKGKRTIAWLDYDGPADEEVISDLALLARTLPVGSVIATTVNASRGRYGPDKEETVAKLKSVFGDLLPEQLPNSVGTKNGFPPIVATGLINQLTRTTNKTWPEQISFSQLYNFDYQDGPSRMVTVGGIIADQPIRDAITNAGIIVPPLPAQRRLELPILSPRERMALDKLLPSKAPLALETIEKALGFPLRPEWVESYRELYRHYPNFCEIVSSA